MIYLLVTILSMSCFMLDLKFLNIKGINVPQAIMANYALALIIAIISGAGKLTWTDVGGVFSNDWWYRGIAAGVMYFISMDLMALSTRRAGVAVTTVSARASLVVPILWAFFFYGERVTGYQWAGIAMVIAALVMIIWQRNNAEPQAAGGKRGVGTALLPLGVFIGLGIISVSMKSSQHVIGEAGSYDTDYPLFDIILFAAALVSAVVYYAVRRGRTIFRFGRKSVVGGLILGACNYLVTWGIMHGLRTLPTSVFYTVYNISVVVIMTLIGTLAFREKLGWRRAAGITLAVAAILVLSTSQAG